MGGPAAEPELPEVMALLAHRYPFLLVDRITEVDRGRRAVGVKRVSAGEWCCVDDAAGVCSMPHLLVVEALAQTAAAILVGLAGAEGALGYFAGIDRVRLRAPATAGAELRLQVELLRFRRGIGRLRGVATADGRLVASADFTVALRPSGAVAAVAGADR